MDEVACAEGADGMAFSRSIFFCISASFRSIDAMLWSHLLLLADCSCMKASIEDVLQERMPVFCATVVSSAVVVVIWSAMVLLMDCVEVVSSSVS